MKTDRIFLEDIIKNSLKTCENRIVTNHNVTTSKADKKKEENKAVANEIPKCGK